MSNVAESTALPNGLWALNFGRMQLEGYLKGFEGARWTAQPTPGANHALWIVGHLAVSNHSLGGMIGAMPELPDGYLELFNMGTEPNADAGAYPPAEEVLAEMWRQRDALVDRLSVLDDAGLNKPFATEGMFQTPAHIMSFVPIHDATHAGQLSMIRKHLNMERVFG